MKLNYFADYDNNVRMIKGAYKKYKSYYYQNRNLLRNRRIISEFENDEDKMNDTFHDLATALSQPRSENTKKYISSLIDKIDFIVLPKKFETEIVQNNKPISNTLPHDKKMKEVNFFIDCPIEISILDTLWTVLLSKIVNDNGILSYDVYGNTINSQGLFENEEICFENRVLFNWYFPKYTSWRNKAFSSLERNYERKKDSVLVSLDIKSYFYSVVINFKRLNFLFGEHPLLEEIKCLTEIMEKVFCLYTSIISEYRLDLPKLKKHCSVLPIGFFSSMVLGNVYLADFDEKVRKVEEIKYYGRYVDDILFVISSKIDKDYTNTDIIRKLFIDNDLLENSGESYTILGYSNLRIQSEKIKIIYIDHEESKAIIDIYNDTIRIEPSQMNPIPDKSFSLNAFDEIAYTVENFTKENKIRDIGRMGIDSFKVGKFFYGLVYRYTHVNVIEGIKEEIDNHYSQISKFFTGSQAIEYYTNWLPFMYFLVLTQRNSQLRKFTSEMRKTINLLKGSSLDRKMYGKPTSINKRIKDALLDNLYVCLYIALSLDSDMANKYFKKYKENVDILRHSNMFEHRLVAFPLANYLDYNKDVSYIKMDVKDIGSIPSDLDKKFKFIWSPRFIHYDEFELLLFYFYHRNITNKEKYEEIDKRLVERYCQINSMPRSTFTIKKTQAAARFEEYVINKTIIPSGNNAIPDTINIAVGSVSLSENKILKGCNRWDNITIQDKDTLDDILRESFKCLADIRKKSNDEHKRNRIKNENEVVEPIMILVLPELYFPIYWIGELIRFAKKSQIGIVTGLQYIEAKKTGNKERKMKNYLATILPFESGKVKYKNAYVQIREKNDYSPIEMEGLAKLGFVCQNTLNASYDIFRWNNINITSLVCYELTDVMVRGLLKGRCDLIAVPVYNPDTTYFSNIIDSASRDLHAFIVQANTSIYGDSRVTGPYDRDSKDIFKIKGGENDHVVIGTIDYKKVKEYEDRYNENLNEKIERCLQGKYDEKPKKKKKPEIKPLSARFLKK